MIPAIFSQAAINSSLIAINGSIAAANSVTMLRKKLGEQEEEQRSREQRSREQKSREQKKR